MKSGTFVIAAQIVALGLIGSAACTNGESAAGLPVTSVPSAISADCRGGVAQLYDECSDQSALLEEALELADAADKTVLVLYGAEWCIWCHVFDKYVKGQSRRFDYEWQYHDGVDQRWQMRERENRAAEEQARRLNEYVAANFVILHLESYHSPNGEAVLSATGFDAASVRVVPQILVLDGKGKFVAAMDDYSSIARLEIREDSGEEYRGFDREILLRELRSLREAALSAKALRAGADPAPRQRGRGEPRRQPRASR